ncbi:MAG: DnaA regulatory inactivator Hda [Oxalobacter sp.]|nr:DnaA regulatory inactivator Hda [Oxalobacter sp.]
MQKQLLLDLGTSLPPSLKDFVVGRNAEVLQLLHGIAERRSPNHFAYLWGEAGTGKTHLLQSLAQYAPARYIASYSPLGDFSFSPEISLYLLDDCDRLPPREQIAAFNLFNQIRDSQSAYLVTAGNCAPMALPLRDDLRSRLCWGLAYQLHGLTDEEKLEALAAQAKSRGINLSAGVLPWLLAHYRRDLHSLVQILDELDHYSLQMKRTVTLPLLHDLLQQKLEQPHD